jgi:transposase
MVRLKLDDRQWKKIATFLAADNPKGKGRPPKNDRLFIEAVLWWRRTGVPWRDLPSEFGPWKSVFNRFDRWAKNGKWQRLFEALQDDVDREWFSIDSTINRAHQHSAGGTGGQKKTRSVGPAAALQPRFT